MKALWKYTLLIIIALALNIGLWANGFEGGRFTVGVRSSSFLIINGFTNVGNFDCSFNMGMFNNGFDVMVSEDADGCLNFENFELLLPVPYFDCGNAQINKDFRDLLKYEEFPQISWKILCLDVTSFENNELQKDILPVNLLVKIAGKERNCWADVEVSKNGNRLAFSGILPINIRDFNLEPPQKFFGLVEVYPTIQINFSVEVIIHAGFPQ
ncbi:MAG: YceI family protein [Salinivirgaceae bacterium]